MSGLLLALASLTLLSGPAFATKDPAQTEFVETRKTKANEAIFGKIRASDADKITDDYNQKSLIESTKELYRNFQDRVRVPGFISSSPLPQLAKVIGPDRKSDLIRVGDTIFIRWSGAPLPRVGERYSTFTPAIVMQNVGDPSDFQVTLTPHDFTQMPKDFRLAGYFYEATSRVRVIRTKNNLVEAMIEQMAGTITVGDELMPLPPLQEKLHPIQGGLQLSAAIVSGSPHDRLSTTERSYLYINRGTRDGIQVGRVFEAIESVRLDEPVAGTSPEQSSGEAMVIYATDSYSTAMIIKQFDVIRIGSLMRTKQDTSPVPHRSPFEGFNMDSRMDREKHGAPDDSLSEIPNMSNPEKSSDTTLPEIPQKPTAPALSELDALERALKLKDLSPEEKLKLGKLSRQEKIGTEKETSEEAGTEEGKAEAAPVENSFKNKKDEKKKKKKKGKARSNEEEELNLLMQQN